MPTISASVYGGMFDSTEVVENVGGFPRGNKAVDSSFFAKIISCFYSDGLFGEDSFKIKRSGGFTIKTDGGIAWISGYMAWQKSELTLTLSPGVSYYVTLQLNIPAGEFSLCASSDTPVSSESIKHLTLAEITIPSGASGITDDMINDTRADSNKCGFVTSTVDSLGILSLAQNANMLGGSPASDFARKSGAVMTGNLKAAPESTGVAVVRNISYGTNVPDTLAEGEIFIQITE